MKLEDVKGVGSSSAENLRNDIYDNDRVVMEVTLKAPNWVMENVDGMGEGNTKNLMMAALHSDISRSSPPSSNALKLKRNYRYYFLGSTGHPDRYGIMSSLKDEEISLEEATSRLMEQDQKALFYTGYFQGGSYSVAISRQTYSKDKVNRIRWMVYSWEKPDSDDSYITLESERRNSKPIRDYFKNENWYKVTDDGAITYQRGEDRSLSDYPNKGPGGFTSSVRLLGIDKGRVAWYVGYRHLDSHISDTKINSLIPVVKIPAKYTDEDSDMKRLYTYSKLRNDLDVELGDYPDLEGFIDDTEWRERRDKDELPKY